MEQAVSLPKIMGVPLSWHDAKPLLENMDGPLAPRLAGRIADEIPGWAEKSVVVHLKVDMEHELQPYYVTEARIRGGECRTNG